MLKLLGMLLPFARELFFDKKEEMDFSSPHFNARKWFQYVSFLILFVLILFVGGRLFTITTKYIHLNNEHASLVEKEKRQRIHLTDLESRLDLLQTEHETMKVFCSPAPSSKPASRPNGHK